MTIWQHKGVWTDKEWLDAAWARIKDLPRCLYCTNRYLELLGQDDRYEKDGALFNICDRVLTCPECGWWFAYQSEQETVEGEIWATIYGLSGNLLTFPCANHVPALKEARSELQHRWDSAKHAISPQVFEDVVASVFRDFGYHAQTTGYSNDGGIDIVLEREHEKAGVQVKRYRNSIKVEQIRAFAGALLLNGLPQGVFVTTANYQAGCHIAADAYAMLGLPIELVNGKEFLAVLGINERPPYEGWKDIFTDAPRQLTRFLGVRIC